MECRTWRIWWSFECFWSWINEVEFQCEVLGLWFHTFQKLCLCHVLITMLLCCSLSFSLDMPGGRCASWWGTSSRSFWRAFPVERAGKLSISTAIWVICIDGKWWSKSTQNSQVGYDSFRFLDLDVRNKFMIRSFDWVKCDRTTHRIGAHRLVFFGFSIVCTKFSGMVKQYT